MSITGLPSETCKLPNKVFHHRNDSEELDVFEAARYYNNEAPLGYNIGATYKENPTKEEHHLKHNWRGERMSLDVPMRNPIPQQTQTLVVEKQILKDKKYKQPSSPGGRLASFLNSIFNQTSSKKKKSKSTNGEEESPGGGRRRRRSSISHFRSSSTNTNINSCPSSDSKSLYKHNSSSSSSIGFRAPPAYAQTPIKSYKELRSFSDHHHQKQVVCLPKPIKDCSLDVEKLKFKDGFLQKPIKEEKRDQLRNFKYNEVINDGNESDSSSDLFELQNYDLGKNLYTSGLPVYETTHMGSIKRGTPIASGTI